MGNKKKKKRKKISIKGMIRSLPSKIRELRDILCGKSTYYDYNLLAGVILLVCFGLVMLYSTSSYESQITFKGNDMYYFTRQSGFSVIAILIAVVVAQIDYHWLEYVAFPLYVAALVLMALVKFTPLGVENYGARRWLKLGVQFQPAEVAKIAIIIFLPMLIVQMGKKVRSLGAVIFLLVIGAIQAVGAFWLTDNLSTGLIIGGIAVLVIFAAHPTTKWFLITGGVVSALAVVGITILGNTMTTHENFRIRRILVWLHPEANLASGGYQVRQALYAIGSGGFFGKGLGNSAQKLGTIPEAQNDMIFAIICEELGVFGALLLLLLFGYVLWRLFVIAQNAPDLYGTLLAFGVFAHIALQVVLNICVVLNLMPTTGITLPFISYGGTSVCFLMMEIALALSVARKIRVHPKNEGETDFD